MPNVTKEALAEHLQIVSTIIGTKGANKEESQFEVYTKEELIERLKEVLPDMEFGYSIVFAADPKDCGR